MKQDPETRIFIMIEENDFLINEVMNAAAPEATPPRRISKKIKMMKTFLPAVPRRGPEAGNPRFIIRIQNPS